MASGNISKPKVLILGGSGFIGRHLVAHLIENDLASLIRVVDKVPPQVAWFNNYFQEIFDNPIVQFKSANLINAVSCENAFLSNDSTTWDYVFNCAGETKLNQSDAVYREGILKLSLNVANQAAKHNVKHFVEISSGQMFSSEKVPHSEDGPEEPWTCTAKLKLQVEKELEKIPNLKYTVLRSAIVYGVGDKTGLMPRILIGAIYKYLGETMKLLWSGDLRINTIHVNDMSRALWYVCGRDDTVGKVFNVVDSADTSQQSITAIIADIFDIKYEFLNNFMSIIAQSNIANILEDINDKHLTPWAEICRIDDIHNTPLTPYMSKEYLLNRNLFLDGTCLSSIGFNLTVPEPQRHLLQEMINDYVQMNVFPKSLL